LDSPKFRVLVAEWDGQPAAYALFFDYYSTFEGRGGLFLEDLYVRDQYRGKGIGKALLVRVAAIARLENCFGVRWIVLYWNTPAIQHVPAHAKAIFPPRNRRNPDQQRLAN